MLSAQTNVPEIHLDDFLASSGATSYEVGTQFDMLPASLTAAHQQTGMDSVYASYGFNGQGQTVAIIDTGIAYDHTALGGGFGSGYQVVGGWDFTEGDPGGEWNPYDDGPYGGHGTHVAGIVGSNDSSHPGVAPGVDLVALRVFDDDRFGWLSWTEQALDWVYQHRNDFDNPITTVNLSIGTSWNSDTLPSWAMLEDEFQMLEQVGVFISAAAGNDFQYYDEPGLDYPAVSPHVVPVMSTNGNGDLSNFTQRHSSAIAAPGQGIGSTVPDYAGNRDGAANDFATSSGTSMAAPYVAGAAVILRQALEQAGRVNIDQDMIYQVMRTTADRIYDAATEAYYLRLNMEKAVEFVLGDVEGHSQSTSSHAGSFGLRRTVTGISDYENDRDYFKFTALRSGTVQVTINADDGLRTQMRRFFADGSSRYTNGTVITMKVRAGETYTIAVRGVEGAGDYKLAFRLTPHSTNLGEVEATIVRNQRISGEKWYRFTPEQDGTLRGESWIKQNTRDIRIELYDADFRRRITGRGEDKNWFDYTVEAGETYYVRVFRTNPDVKVRLSNLGGAGPANTTASSASPAQPSALHAANRPQSDAARLVADAATSSVHPTGLPNGEFVVRSTEPASHAREPLNTFRAGAERYEADLTPAFDRIFARLSEPFADALADRRGSLDPLQEAHPWEFTGDEGVLTSELCDAAIEGWNIA